jgi:hypothetical protein
VAEREREGSVVKSAQRMSVRPAAQCRETGVPVSAAKTHRRARTHYCNHQHRTISRRREPSSWTQPESPRAKFCSTALQPIAFRALRAWNETDTWLVLHPPLLPARQTHNDLKSQTMSRSRPRQLCHARRISYFAQSRMRRDCSRFFFWRIDNRRDRGRTNFVRWNGLDWFDWVLTRFSELRLLDACRQ